MQDQETRAFTAYARQKLFRILTGMVRDQKDLNWSVLADRITLDRGVNFQRLNFYRLRDGTLSDANIEIIVEWLEERHDSKIRQRLVPLSNFDEAARSCRDYYFYVPKDDDLDALDEQVFQAFEGTYLCASPSDKNTFMPLPTVRRYFATSETWDDQAKANRSQNFAQYAQERTFLILHKTGEAYFYAAEFPMSALFPSSIGVLDLRTIYEGFAVACANMIYVQLRECLTRLPKTHAILIAPKSTNEHEAPRGLTFFLSDNASEIKREWSELPDDEIEHLKAEHCLSLESEFHLKGPVQIADSPLAFMRNRAGAVFMRDRVYLKKPDDFLDDLQLHFVLPELENKDEVRKIVESPLYIGASTWP